MIGTVYQFLGLVVRVTLAQTLVKKQNAGGETEYGERNARLRVFPE
jgi:hypothetical protein